MLMPKRVKLQKKQHRGRMKGKAYPAATKFFLLVEYGLTSNWKPSWIQPVNQIRSCA